MNSSTKSAIAVTYGVVAGLLVATHALPVCDFISQLGRCRCHGVRGVEDIVSLGIPSLLRPNSQGRKLVQSETSRMMIGGDDRVFAFNLRKTLKEHTGVREKRFKAYPLFSGNSSNNNANDALRLFTRKNFIITGVFLLLPPILLELYSRFGTFSISNKGKKFISNKEATDKNYYSFVPPPKHTEWNNVKQVTIVFHGAGGKDVYTDELMNRLDDVDKKSKSPQEQSSYNHIVDWSKYSTNILQASYNGQQIGELAAKEILEQVTSSNNNLTTIHFIGISVGAFAADAAVKEVKKNFEISSSTKEENNSNNTDSIPPFVQLTLLDPFQQRGIFGVGYGNNEFGKSADYAEQYLNTDDPVPSTNKPLKNTVCYDVTSLRPRSIFGHDWPLVYYARSDNCGQLQIDNQEQQNERRKTGTVVVL